MRRGRNNDVAVCARGAHCNGSHCFHLPAPLVVLYCPAGICPAGRPGDAPRIATPIRVWLGKRTGKFAVQRPFPVEPERDVDERDLVQARELRQGNPGRVCGAPVHLMP